MSETRYDAIVFDVDEVLVHFDKQGMDRWRADMQGLGLDMQRMDAFWTNPDTKRRLLTGGSLLAEIDRLLKAQCSTVDPEWYMQGWFRAGLLPDCELIAFIGHWSRQSGMPVFLATNNYPERKIFLWSADGVNLGAVFDGIACSSDLGLVKTDPVYFIKAEVVFGLTGKRLKFFDDDDRYVRTACSAGWDAELFPPRTGAGTRADVPSCALIIVARSVRKWTSPTRLTGRIARANL